MTTEKVRAYLAQFGKDKDVLEFDVSSATVDLAAKALGTGPERIAKTLAFNLDEEYILIVMAGDCKVDNSKYKAQFHKKAKMCSPEETIAASGYAIGGVCPFDNPLTTKVYLDESLKRFDVVYPACGTANSAVPMTMEDLDTCTRDAEWIDVTKLKEQQ